jgi:hypothetical protein
MKCGGQKCPGRRRSQRCTGLDSSTYRGRCLEPASVQSWVVPASAGPNTPHFNAPQSAITGGPLRLKIRRKIPTAKHPNSNEPPRPNGKRRKASSSQQEYRDRSASRTSDPKAFRVFRVFRGQPAFGLSASAFRRLSTLDPQLASSVRDKLAKQRAESRAAN